MKEKIKVRMSSASINQIDTDCDKFELYKNDGKINRNALITRIIINYLESFERRMDKSKDSIHYLSFFDNENTCDKTLSIQPTKESEKTIAYIEGCLLKESTLSSFFRSMILSYLSLSQEDREKIIFRKENEEILHAIENKRQLFFQVKDKEFKHIESPYVLASSKEEMHNYLLTKSKKGYRKYRLNRLTSVKMLEEPSSFTAEDKTMFERMQKYGPQYTYEINEKPIFVKLTEKGKRMFHDLYVHRPICDGIEDDVYEFRGSHDQIIFYFSRFGKEAYIISPDEARKELYKFYKESYLYYQKIYVEGQKRRSGN